MTDSPIHLQTASFGILDDRVVVDLEYLEETGTPGGNWRTWRKLEHLEETGGPGGNWSTWRKLEHLEETGGPGGNWSTWRKLEHLEETGGPGGNWSTWRKLEDLEETGAPGGNWSTWRKLEHLEETGGPGGNWSTWRKLEHLEETGGPGGNWSTWRNSGAATGRAYILHSGRPYSAQDSNPEPSFRSLQTRQKVLWLELPFVVQPGICSSVLDRDARQPLERQCSGFFFSQR
uniref:Uncharacterized protein n=1 Tax=Knipowitschia caucasica TaxID=637954 RepID=A0AAV2JFW7_KNICA